jgi:mycofactocin system glycosyltransferase
LTVVVPVRDRPDQLRRCLAAVRAACPGAPVVVVDDGSTPPVGDLGAGVRVLRHAVAHGPAAARNTGLAACRTPLVAFVDSDVEIGRAAVDHLLGHLEDPRVAVVAPRVAAQPPARGPVAAYEARHSALDMGPAPALVAPGRPVSYLPSTALVVRRSAMGAGFDETLIIGEDVDLVWRLAREGWRIRYEPAAVVRHDHPESLGRFVARRHLYARSIGMLARRHPDAVSALWVSPALALPWALLLAGRRTGAGLAAGVAVARTAHRLGSWPLAVAVVARGLLMTGVALAHAARRPWAPPLALLALRRPRVRRLLVAAYLTPVLQDARASGRLCEGASDAPMRLLDELVAAAGTWHGCLEERTLRPLLPAWYRPGRDRP